MAENGLMPGVFYQFLHNLAHLAIRYPLAFVEEVLSFYLRRSSKSLVFDKFYQSDLENAAVSLSIRMEYELISIQIDFFLHKSTSWLRYPLVK